MAISFKQKLSCSLRTLTWPMSSETQPTIKSRRLMHKSSVNSQRTSIKLPIKRFSLSHQSRRSPLDRLRPREPHLRTQRRKCHKIISTWHTCQSRLRTKSCSNWLNKIISYSSSNSSRCNRCLWINLHSLPSSMSLVNNPQLNRRTTWWTQRTLR